MVIFSGAEITCCHSYGSAGFYDAELLSSDADWRNDYPHANFAAIHSKPAIELPVNRTQQNDHR
ncbi:MAG: hypothetical protein ACKVKV_08885, partial [Dehalococcoidia bacterium]